MNFTFLLIPFVSGMLGWLFNVFASRYFIHKYLLGNKEHIADIVEKEINNLLPLTALEDKIHNGDLLNKAMPMIEKHIDDFLNTKLQQEIPMLGMFIGTKTTDTIKGVFLKELKLLFPQVMVSVLSNSKNNLNIKKLVQEKLEDPSFNKFIYGSLVDPIRKYRLSGFISGLIIGVINLLLIKVLFH